MRHSIKNNKKLNFDKWNSIKNVLDNRLIVPYFYEGEIWFIAMGINIGFEENGKGNRYQRPVLILKKFNKDVFWGVAITSKKKYGQYYHGIDFRKGTVLVNNTAILSQLRLYSSKRLLSKLGMINDSNLVEIKKAVNNIINS